MPLDPRSPAYQAALDGYIAEVEKLMREKLTGLGDFKNLADMEAELDRLALRMELLSADPEFAEVVKRLEAKRLDLGRKRDQIKPFMMKLERELAIYKAAQAAGGAANAGSMREPFAAPAPPPMAPVPAAAPPAPPAWQTMAPAQPAPPQPAPRAAAPPPMRAPAPPPIPPQAPPLPAFSTAAMDMSLPDEEEIPGGSIVSATSDFITGPGDPNGSFDNPSELLLADTEPLDLADAEPLDEPFSPPPPAAAPIPASAPDPFASFGGAGPPRPAAPAPPPSRPGPNPARPIGPAAAPRPAAPPAGAPAAKPGVPPGAKPPWVK